MEVQETPLPGIGLRHDFRTERGRHVGVVTYRSGRRELLLYDDRDEDEVAHALVLSEEESSGLAGLLGAPRLVQHLEDAIHQVPGVVVQRVDLDSRSPFAGRPLGDTAARTRTGTSVVALLRGDSVVASPGPQDRLHAGDVLVVVGTPGGVEALTELLRG